MRLTLLIFSLSLTQYCSAQSAGNTQANVSQAANKVLFSFLNNIPAGSESQFGFHDRNEINAATIGQAYQVVSLKEAFYFAQLSSASDYGSFVGLTPEWRVQVMAKGTSHVLLRVVTDSGRFEGVDLGGAGLSHDMEAALPERKTGHEYYLFKINELSADFLVDAPGGSLTNAVYIPLPSARMALATLGKNPKCTLPEALTAINNALNLIREKQ